jgi:hypothetical protein
MWKEVERRRWPVLRSRMFVYALRNSSGSRSVHEKTSASGGGGAGRWAGAVYAGPRRPLCSIHGSQTLRGAIAAQIEAQVGNPTRAPRPVIWATRHGTMDCPGPGARPTTRRRIVPWPAQGARCKVQSARCKTGGVVRQDNRTFWKSCGWAVQGALYGENMGNGPAF